MEDVVVLGVRAAVARASQELQRYVSDPEGYSVESLPKAPESDSEEHAAEKAWLARAKDGSGDAVVAPAWMGAVTKLKPPEEQPAAPRASSKRNVPAVQDCQGKTCPCCGAGRFCSGCGVQVWQVNVLNFCTPAQGMLTAGMSMQPNGEMTAQAMGGADHFEHESQMPFSWGPVQQPQMMFYANPKTAGKTPMTGMVPMQLPAMQGSPGGAAGGATQSGQMGMMQAYMVPAGIVPAWCGL